MVEEYGEPPVDTNASSLLASYSRFPDMFPTFQQEMYSSNELIVLNQMLMTLHNINSTVGANTLP